MYSDFYVVNLMLIATYLTYVHKNWKLLLLEVHTRSGKKSVFLLYAKSNYFQKEFAHLL